jgi:hypothetical protein
MHQIYDNLQMASRIESKLNKCNIDRLAGAMYRQLEREFNVTFETIVALNDFAHRTYYDQDMTCKIKVIVHINDTI